MKLFVRFILLGLILIATGCENKPLRTDGSLKKYVLNSLKGDSGIVDLRNYKNAKWDKLYIIPPYASSRELDQNLARYSHYILKNGIGHREDLSLVALFDGSVMVSLTEFYNNEAYFTNARKFKNNLIDYYYKKETNFRYKIVVNHYYIQKPQAIR